MRTNGGVFDNAIHSFKVDELNEEIRMDAGLILLIWQDDWQGVFLWAHCLQLEQLTEEDCLYRIADNFKSFFEMLVEHFMGKKNVIILKN